MAGRDDLVDEGGPIVGPFLLEDGDKDEIELVKKRFLALQTFLRARTLDDEAYDEVSYT